MMTWSTAPLIADHKPINIATTRCLCCRRWWDCHHRADDSCFIHVRDIASVQLVEIWEYDHKYYTDSIMDILTSDDFAEYLTYTEGPHSLENYKTQSGYKMTGTMSGQVFLQELW